MLAQSTPAWFGTDLVFHHSTPTARGRGFVLRAWQKHWWDECRIDSVIQDWQEMMIVSDLLLAWQLKILTVSYSSALRNFWRTSVKGFDALSTHHIQLLSRSCSKLDRGKYQRSVWLWHKTVWFEVCVARGRACTVLRQLWEHISLHVCEFSATTWLSGLH